MKRALVVVAKEPAAGKTKTRLKPFLTDGEATELYRCFLLDTLGLMQQIAGVQPIVAYLPLEAEAFFRRIVPAGFVLMPQEGADLSERLHNVFRHHLENGYGQVVIMDSDSPTLPAYCLRQAFEALDDPGVDAVLGPCEDGGYYLVGLKKPCAALFEGMVMSTPSVLTETLDRARLQQLHVVCLPRWYDIDTPGDLQRLWQELDQLPRDAAPHTRRFLAHGACRPTPQP